MIERSFASVILSIFGTSLTKIESLMLIMIPNYSYFSLTNQYDVEKKKTFDVRVKPNSFSNFQ